MEKRYRNKIIIIIIIKTLDDELQDMPHSKIRKLKPLTRLEPAHQHCGQALARRADMLTTTHASPLRSV